MTPEEWEQVGEIFDAASELPEEHRALYLREACLGDMQLQGEVESLLAAGSGAGSFISEPIAGSLITEPGEPVRSLSPGSVVGRYRIERAIGFGGMGEVYLATDTRLGRSVALKTLPVSLCSDPNFIRRFRTEAQAAANINHPNVATIYSVEDFADLPVITMEFVEGQTLDLIFPESGLDIARFLEWFEPLAGALAYAHRRGIIHRDVKPGNLMISDDGTPKILDFGLAQMERNSASRSLPMFDITAPGQIIGTPSYMSPEQAEGETVDGRSDIFSFGTVMYEALTGKRPFGGDSPGRIVQSVVNHTPERVSKLNPEVPAHIAKMVTRCLEKSPAMRFQSMKEVHRVLKDARSATDAGVSMDSFARRFYREATSPSKIWWALAVIVIMAISASGWYLFTLREILAPISVDRMSMRRLSQSNNVVFAAIAPDGKSIVYVTYEDNGDRAMWLRRVSDASAIPIVAPAPVLYWDCPMFSDDGEYIYYITAMRAATHGTMYRVPALGGPPRKIVEKVNHLGNISPDGQRILFVRYGDADPNLSVNTAGVQLVSANSADGSDEKVMRVTQGETIIREPRYSADGRSLIYVVRELVDDVEFWSIVTSDLATGRQTELVRRREGIGEVAVLQKANGLLVTASDPATNRRQLYHVSIPDGKMTRVTNDVNFYVGASVDRDGVNIVSAQRSEENRVWVGDANDLSELKQLTREPLAHQGVDWTPDGRVVYDYYVDNRRQIGIADADGKNALLLTPRESENFEPHVSGDGRYIVFTSRRSGYNQIWRMDIDGANQVLLSDVPGIAQYPRFEADGSTVVFRWFNEGSTPLGRVSVNGGPVTGIQSLPRSIAYFWSMSPDGERVAFTTTDHSTNKMYVVVADKRSGAVTATLDIWPSRIFKWMPDGSAIYYQERQGGANPQTKVYQVDPQKKTPKLLLSTEPEGLVDLTYSRDGKKVAIVKGKVMSDAIMLSSADAVPREH